MCIRDRYDALHETKEIARVYAKKAQKILEKLPNIFGKEKNFFKDYGIELLINSPERDNYKYSPAKQIELGISDFGLAPTESVISFRTKNNPFKLIAVAALFQSDISAIVVTDDSGIKRPKDLDGKSYASYGARYEDLIVKQLIKNDGGLGDVNISYPNRLGVWDTVSNKTFDSTWIFMNWEGIEKPNFNFSIETSPNPRFGEVSTNIAMINAKNINT